MFTVPQRCTRTPKRVKHRRLDCQRIRSRLGVGSVGDVHVVRPVARHEGVSRYSMQYSADHGPLAGGVFPSAIGFFFRQLHHGAEAHVDVQCIAFDKHAAPDDLSGLANAFQRAAAERKIHGRLTFAGCARISADKMIRWRGSGNLQHPNEIVDAVALKLLSPTHVVQRGRRIEAQRSPAAICHQGIRSGAFVHFIEVRQRAGRHTTPCGCFPDTPADDRNC